MSPTAKAQIKLTPCTEAVLADLRSIYNHYVLHSTATFHQNAVDRDAFRTQVIFNEEKYKTLVVESTGKVLGYGSLLPYKSRCGYADTAEVSIYLKEEYTGDAYAGPLLIALEAHAAEHGLRTLLAGVCTENVHSAHFFKKHQYTECAHFKEVGKKFNRILDVVYFQKILVNRETLAGKTTRNGNNKAR